MNTSAALTLAASTKAGASGVPGKAPRHGAGQAGDALGFLAELAAAIGSTGPLGQALPLPGQQSTSGNATGSASGDVLASTTPADPTGTLPEALAGPTVGASVLFAAAPAAIPPGSPSAAAPGAASRLQAPATSTATSPLTSAATSTGIASVGTGSDTLPVASAQSAGTTSTLAMPVEATAPRPQSPAQHRARPADTAGPASAVSDQATSSTPSAADRALTTDSAAVGIDPFSAAAAPTSAAVTTDDGTGQTTAVLRQVFPEITRVATTPGTHRLAITLHPDDLGEVRVTVVVRGESVRVDVATDPTSGTARTALEHGAPELRRLLESVGTSARVEFREFGTGTGLGSATDGGRQQPQGFAQAHSQGDARGDAQGSRQPRPQVEPSPASGPPSGPAATQAASDTRSVPVTPTVRHAASGLDRLI